MAQIEVRGLCVAYENRTVIEGLSFSVSAGDYLCVVGENGSGKSTLIKAILGLKQIKSGAIEFGDGLLQTQIGYLPQQTIQTRDFPATVKEVVLSGAVGAGKLFLNRADRERAYNNMRLLGIEQLAKHSFCELSGGQKQRTLLARALCSTKKLILLDEPTAALDPQAAEDLYEIIEKINRENKITVIMVSHDMKCIDYATHVLHMGSSDIFVSREEYLKRSDSGA